MDNYALIISVTPSYLEHCKNRIILKYSSYLQTVN